MQAKNEMEAIKSLNEKVAGIVESGSNENGSWVKFSDGTMICYGSTSANANSDYYTLTFPCQFIDSNYSISITNIYSYSSNIIWNTGALNPNNVILYPRIAGQATIPTVQTMATYTVIGRWK